MGETLKRKCLYCGEEIYISKGNINIVSWKNKNYHPDCFVNMCERRVLKADRYSPSYQEALDNVENLRKETRKKFVSVFARDDLNEHLLTHYDVSRVSDRFWETTSEIANGEFKKKKCRPTGVYTLLETWKWYQKELDNIDMYNKANKKGPKNDEQRIPYDLAIVLGKVPEYLKEKKKIKAEEADRALQAKQEIKIDYSKIKPKREKHGIGDISDLLDEI